MASQSSTLHALLSRALPAVAILACAAVGSLLLLSSERNRAEREIYEQRLEQLADRYAELQSLYNSAVRKTAVTELIVDQGQLSVRIRTADGQTETIQTPYNPAREIYVDYAVIDSRVLIRRVFDQDTPPSQATLIDPTLQSIDWDPLGYTLGKAVYRSLSEGRWIVSVTGNGSLGLTRLDDNAPSPQLTPAPEAIDFAELQHQLDQDLGKITTSQLLARVLGQD